MSSDLVERLRDTPCNREPFTAAHANCQCRLANAAANDIERLQAIIDSRPAINAALPQSYIDWSRSIYEIEAVQSGRLTSN